MGVIVRRAKAPPKRKRPSSTAPSAVHVAKTKAREVSLPTAKKQISRNIRDYSILWYAPPKWGKTTLLSTFPDPLFLLTEPGAEGLAIFSFNHENGGITEWPIMQRAVELLLKEDRFKNVAMDTLDEGYRLCLEWVCQQEGIEHPSDIKDFGKTWGKVTNEFTRIFRLLKNTGRGVYMTSHSSETTVERADGKEVTKVSPSLGGKSGAKVLALADFIFYGDYMKDAQGRDRRVVITEGNERLTAGHRKIGGNKVGLPKYILLPEDESQDYEVFAAAFRGELPPVDPALLQITTTTTESGAELLNKDRAKSARAALAKSSK